MGDSRTTGNADSARLPLHRHARQRRHDARPGHPRRDSQLRLRHQRQRADRGRKPTAGPPLYYHAFLYTGTPGVDGMMHDLGTLGPFASMAYAINNDGQVTGTSQVAAGDLQVTPSSTPARLALMASCTTWGTLGVVTARASPSTTVDKSPGRTSVERQHLAASRLPLHRHARCRRHDARPGHLRRWYCHQ